MKRLVFTLVILALLIVPSTVGANESCKGGDCTTIQDGTIYASTGELITTGYDEFGYNYQAHMFNGRYCDYDRVLGGDYCDDNLIMKWNDAWLSNKDCDGDGLLDRHYGFDSYIGSGAWLTNHMSGGKGKDHWTYFCKIVAAPADAHVEEGIWYAADGTEIGPVIWGAFAIIQEVESGEGATYVSPSGPGLGNW
ncbi:MAG: hypothetical protein SXV54_26935 [Chloroflexota bacterium]|nr:hypothetical protein [Chloroflexota bacterium]